MSDLELAEASAPADAPVTPASDTAQAAETTSTDTPAIADAGQSIDKTLREAWDKLNPRRDDTGRFEARKTATEAAPTETTETPESADQTAEKASEPAKPAIEPPHSWSAEAKAQWASVPPAAQAYIAEREAQAHQAITRAGQQIKAYEPIARVLNSYRETFEKNGLAPDDGIGRLLEVERNLATDPASTIVQIAQAYGVDLTTLTNGQSASASTTEQGQPDPQVATLKAELAQLKTELGKVGSYLTAQQRAQIQGEQHELARQIAEFAKDKPHFDAVRRHMGALMQADESLSLDTAYEQATWALPNIRQSILADQQKANEEKRTEEARKKAADAKKAAAVNVKSSTSSGNTPKSMDDTLRETARRLYPDARL
jgi:hypothetical protein